MLIEKTFKELTRGLLQKSNTMNRFRHEIARFEEFCAVLRQHDINFKESIDVDDEVNYYITPKAHSDYLAIVNTVSAFGAHRTHTSEECEIVNVEPEAPSFWLHKHPAK